MPFSLKIATSDVTLLEMTGTFEGILVDDNEQCVTALNCMEHMAPGQFYSSVLYVGGLELVAIDDDNYTLYVNAADSDKMYFCAQFRDNRNHRVY